MTKHLYADLSQKVTVEFEQTSYSVSETVDNIIITISASGTFEGAINLTVNTIAMTATGNCT